MPAQVNRHLHNGLGPHRRDSISFCHMFGKSYFFPSVRRQVWFSCMIESNGVYEATRRWIDENGFDIQRQRHWFRLIDGRAYDLEYNEVLDAVAQCEGWNGGAALCC